MSDQDLEKSDGSEIKLPDVIAAAFDNCQRTLETAVQADGLVTEALTQLKTTLAAWMANIENTAGMEPVDQALYSQKVARLLGFAENISYRAKKKEEKTGDWHSTGSYLKHLQGLFYKILFIVKTDSATGATTVLPFLAQEADQYDSHTCDKEIGKCVLPVRRREGKLEAAITLRNPPGAYGNTMFCVPRYSLSNPNRTAFSEAKSIQSNHQRPDFMRLTGQINCRVAMVDETLAASIDDQREKIVWFSIPELRQLLEDTRMQDSMSITLIQWLCTHHSEIQ